MLGCNSFSFQFSYDVLAQRVSNFEAFAVKLTVFWKERPGEYLVVTIPCGELSSVQIYYCINQQFPSTDREMKHIFTVRNVVAARLCFYEHLSFCSGGGGVSQHALGRHPLDRHPPLSSACWDTHTPLPSTCWDTRPAPATTAADGTHPTGMHSCSTVYTSLPQKSNGFVELSALFPF